MYPTKLKKGTKMEDVINVLSPCTVTYSSNCVYIKSDVGNYMFTSSGERLYPKELAYIKKFRKYFVENGKEIKCQRQFVNHKSKYFKFFVKEGVHKDVVEIDINNAYPSAGHILGIVPKDLYEESQTFFDENGKRRKEAGLIAIGSLYRNRRIIKVSQSGRRTVLQDGERLEYLSDLWKSITGFTDLVVEKVAKKVKDDIYFYWCDALFVKKSVAETVKGELLKYGFTCKEVPINKLEFKNNKAYSYRKDGEIKPYSFPKVSFTVKNMDELITRYRKNDKEIKV